MIPRPFRVIGPAVLLIAASGSVGAQTMPAPGVAAQQNPACSRLEAQLAALDRGGTDPARADQIRRYEEALQNQQVELDRTVMQSRRAGCEGSGFFLFGRNQTPQCDDLNTRIQRMRSNLDRLNTDLQQLQSSRGPVEGQRRQLLMALGQYDCGPQYRSAAAAQRPRGFFETLFGGGGGGGTPFGSGDLTPSDQSSSFRTICVRTCDGYYFPVSYATSQARFRDDEQACQRMCPAAEVMLYSYRNPGEDVAQAVSISGQQYTSLPNAFKYRQEFNAACSCRRQGESWADALRHLDDTTVEQGDVIVTEENAKALSQPKPDLRAAKQTARGTKADPKAQAAATPPPEPAAAATSAPVSAAPLPDATQPAAPDPPAAEPGKRTIRTVGPPFVAR
jgi:Protein of unknown function (DUF2865)